MRNEMSRQNKKKKRYEVIKSIPHASRQRATKVCDEDEYHEKLYHIN